MIRDLTREELNALGQKKLLEQLDELRRRKFISISVFFYETDMEKV